MQLHVSMLDPIASHHIIAAKGLAGNSYFSLPSPHCQPDGIRIVHDEVTVPFHPVITLPFLSVDHKSVPNCPSIPGRFASSDQPSPKLTSTTAAACHADSNEYKVESALASILCCIRSISSVTLRDSYLDFLQASSTFPDFS
jgi:hypothetical protein